MESQEGYNHISKKDLTEMIDVVSYLHKSQYVPTGKLDLCYNCFVAEEKFGFVPEVSKLVKSIKNENHLSYPKANKVLMNNGPTEEFYHIHTNELNKMVLLLGEMVINKIINEKISDEEMKLAKNYLEFKTIREFAEYFEGI